MNCQKISLLLKQTKTAGKSLNFFTI